MSDTTNEKEVKSPSRYEKPGEPDRYAKLEAEMKRFKIQNDEMRKELDAERATRTDAERYAKLQSLRQRYVFDLAAEFENMKYGKASDEQFAQFAGTGGMIERNFASIPDGEELPHFGNHVPGNEFEPKPEKYSKEQRDKAMRYCTERSLKGERVEYKDVLERIAAGEKLD